MLWARDLGDGPRWATPRAAAHAGAHLDDARSKAGRLAPGSESELIGLLSALRGGAQTLDWAGPLVEVLEHDGHAPGHAALYLPGDGVLIGCGELEATGVVCASAVDGVPGDQGM